MIVTEKTNGLVEISTDADHILHRIADEEYSEIRRATIKAEAVTDWEEVEATTIPPYTAAEYGAKVTELIRERYSVDDEFALINNVLAGATEQRQAEYAAYQEYRAACKERAKTELSQREEDQDGTL